MIVITNNDPDFDPSRCEICSNEIRLTRVPIFSLEHSI